MKVFRKHKVKICFLMIATFFVRFPNNLDVPNPTQESTPTLLNAARIADKSPSLLDVDFVVPSYPGGLGELNSTLLRSLQFFWPKNQLNINLIFDEHVPNHAVLEEQVASFMRPNVNWKLQYNPQDDPKRYKMGWLIQQLIQFWSDNFTDAEYVALVDDDTLVARQIMHHDLFDEYGRPHIVAKYKREEMSGSWTAGCSEWALNHTVYLYGMSYFPVILRRKDLVEIRRHILNQHPEFKTFDDLFSAFTKRCPYSISQFEIMVDWLWNYKRDQYSWHLDPYRPRDNRLYSRGTGRSGTPEQNGVTSTMLEPFPRCMVHASYVVKDFESTVRENLVSEMMRRGYCLSLPLLYDDSDPNRNDDDNATMSDRHCIERYQTHTNLSTLSEFEFEARTHHWPYENDSVGRMRAHQERMKLNTQTFDWDKAELNIIFPEKNDT